MHTCTWDFGPQRYPWSQTLTYAKKANLFKNKLLWIWNAWDLCIQKLDNWIILSYYILKYMIVLHQVFFCISPPGVPVNSVWWNKINSIFVSSWSSVILKCYCKSTSLHNMSTFKSTSNGFKFCTDLISKISIDQSKTNFFLDFKSIFLKYLPNVTISLVSGSIYQSPACIKCISLSFCIHFCSFSLVT